LAELSLLPGFERVDLVPDYGRREQELTFERLLVYHARNYVAQHHCRYSRATQFSIDAFSLIPIILVRNIFDCVVSLIDHIDSEDSANALAYIPNEYRAWDHAKKMDFVIEMIMPWYMNFFVGWNDFASAYWINYEQLVSNPFETIQKTAGELKLGFRDSEIRAALVAVVQRSTRKNVGRIGRGSILSDAQKAKIQGLASYYPSINFSRIGLAPAKETTTNVSASEAAASTRH
jgi:hypothetical protein